MRYGGDYNPEQWPRSTWLEDVRLMQQAGVNGVTVGVFAWSRIQRAEGSFDWEWLDEILGLLHEGGIGVDLATATASPPPWATKAYPAMLACDQDGHTLGPGSRQHYAPSSPDYRRLAAELVTAIADRYADHPAVRMWHVNNEFGCHVPFDYSDNARDAFQEWLRRKYGSVDELNAAWGTAFWGQLYTEFDEILPPRKAPYFHNPGALLDFRRFNSDAMLQLYVAERDLIRAAGATQPITTNLMGAFPALDYWSLAKEMDLISDDSYPDPNDREGFRATAFTRDLMRCLKPGVPWMVMEQAVGAINNRPSNADRAPGEMAGFGMQSVGRGADAMMFFQWRQSRHGAEMFHSAMLPHAGTHTRTWRDVVNFGRALGRLPELPAGPSMARIGLVFDWENWWALDFPGNPVLVDYEAIVRRWHAAAQRLHLAVDLIHPEADLRGYNLVLAPLLHLVTEKAGANLASFVELGGCLLATAFSDVIDPNAALRKGGFTVALRETLGIEVHEFGALPLAGDATAPGSDKVTVAADFGSFGGELLAERIVVRGARVLGRFASGNAEGLPAFTVKASGAGEAYYVATIPDAEGTVAIVRELARRVGVEPVLGGVPNVDVDVSRLGDVVTVVNFGDEIVTVPVAGTDLFTGCRVESLVLDRFDGSIIRLDTCDESASGKALT